MTAPDFPPTGRLVDTWRGGTDRDPFAVIAEYRSRAPAWLRSQIRPMTAAEERLWRYVGDRSWMRADVFSQIPVFIPETGRGFVFGFLMPLRAVAIEVVAKDPCHSLGALAAAMAQDDLVREKAGIATVRCLEATVLKDAKAVAESIRWTLGLDEGGDRFHGMNVPRR